MHEVPSRGFCNCNLCRFNVPSTAIWETFFLSARIATGWIAAGSRPTKPVAMLAQRLCPHVALREEIFLTICPSWCGPAKERLRSHAENCCAPLNSFPQQSDFLSLAPPPHIIPPCFPHPSFSFPIKMLPPTTLCLFALMIIASRHRHLRVFLKQI